MHLPTTQGGAGWCQNLYTHFSDEKIETLVKFSNSSKATWLAKWLMEIGSWSLTFFRAVLILCPLETNHLWSWLKHMPHCPDWDDGEHERGYYY